MTLWWAWFLIGCGGEREGGGSAIGNPGKVAVRLALDDRAATATAGTLEVVLVPCDGEAVSVSRAEVDLAGGPALSLPGGEACALEVALSSVVAPALGAADASLGAVIPLDGLRLDERDWVLELGEPDAPLDTERRSGLFLELEPDGWLDPLERGRGPEAAGGDRVQGAFDPPILAVVGAPALLAPLAGPEAPSYATFDDGEVWFDVAYDDGRLVAVGGESAGRAAVSVDLGLTWTLSEPEVPLGAVAPFDDVFYAASAWGRVLASADGLTWGSRSDEPGVWRDVAAGPPGVVVVGDDAVLFSADGASFARVDLGLGIDLFGVTWGPPGFVAVGTSGARLFSADGQGWDLVDTGGDKLVTAAWSGAEYVATGHQETWTSLDGQSWAPLPHKDLTSLTRHQGELYGVTGPFVFRSADDGATWTQWRAVDEAAFLLGITSNAP